MKKIHLLLWAFITSLMLAPVEAKTQRADFNLLFGSCLHQDKPQPIWEAINQQPADVFMLLGDNIYGDTEDMDELVAKYNKQKSKKGYQILRENTQVIGIWDDHDFGENDAGAEYPKKAESKKALLAFFDEPKGSEREKRTDGAYTSYIFGEAPHRVQVILLDLRWNRTPLKSVNRLQYSLNKAPKNLGPYLPIEDTSATMLGEQQWQWLAQQLREPAEVRIVGSSIQLLSEFTGWESWANFPHERTRILTMLDTLNIDNLVFASGDTHWGELSMDTTPAGRPVWELTSSGLTENWHQISPNKHRFGAAFSNANFGHINIQWPNEAQSKTKLEISLKDVNGDLLKQQYLLF